MVLSQKHSPIGLVLQGGGPIIPFTFGVPGLGAIRPQEYSLGRSSRGAVIHTAKDAFLDTFGEGVPQLSVSGHTGWGSGRFVIPGILLFKVLEFLFNDYHRRTMNLVRAGQSPTSVQLWWLDTLNLQALSIYPLHFVAKKTSSHPLLYYYSLQALVLADLLQGAVNTVLDSVKVGNAPNLASGFGDLSKSMAA